MTVDFSQLEQQNGLPPGMLSAVMQQESGGNPNAISPKGAIGSFQFMPQTAQQYGIDPANPDQSAQAAATMLGQLQQKYNGDIPSTLAGYNWGQGNVDRQGIQNAPPETQNYIQNIMGKIGNTIVPSAQAAEMPAPPPGFVLDGQSPQQVSSLSTPPPGFVLDGQSSPQEAVQNNLGIVSDSIKGFGRGIGQGAIGLATMPFDLGAQAGGYLAKKAIGNSTLGLDANSMAYNALNSIFGPGGLPEKPPSVTGAVFDATGLNGQAQTVPGQFAQTIGNFVPAVAAATMGNGQPLSSNLMTIAKESGLMGAGDETAGQLTNGTAAEPYARIAGSLAGHFVPSALDSLSGGGSNLMAGMTARSVDQMQAEADALKSGAGKTIEGAKQSGVVFNPEKSQGIVDAVNAALNKKDMIPEMNPKTLAIVNKISSLAETSDLGLSQLAQYRTMLNRIAPTEDGVSAGAVKKAIDSSVNSATEDDLIGGTTDAIKQLNIGRANYAAASRFEDISDLLSKANGDPNRIKAALSRFASDPDNYRGWPQAQVMALKTAADTGIVENLLKAFGKFGFSMGKPGVGNTVLPALSMASQAVGNPVGIPLAIGGTAARLGQTYLARGKADKLLDMLSQMKANGAMQ